MIMNGIREVALAYFQNCSDEDRESVLQFYRAIDTNGDGKVSLSEYLKFFHTNRDFHQDVLFRALDMDENGSLDLEEVITLYFVSNAWVTTCDHCKELLKGAYFSCFQCFFSPAASGGPFNLCCDCYGHNKFRHHDDANFYDNQTLLHEIRSKIQQERRTYNDELQQTAEAYYETVTHEIRSKAKEFFLGMNENGDTKVSLPEYLKYMREQGYDQMATPEFFKSINKSGSGTLEFMEVMVLYYIIQTGRQFCEGCRVFIRGLFFACVQCFETQHSTFTLCPTCFKLHNYVHTHTNFLDNYALLETKRLLHLKEITPITSSNIAYHVQNSTSAIVPPHHQCPSHRLEPSTSAIVPLHHHRPSRRLNQLVQLMSLASSVTGIGSTVATVMGMANCSIM